MEEPAVHHAADLRWEIPLAAGEVPIAQFKVDAEAEAKSAKYEGIRLTILFLPISAVLSLGVYVEFPDATLILTLEMFLLLSLVLSGFAVSWGLSRAREVRGRGARYLTVTDRRVRRDGPGASSEFAVREIPVTKVGGVVALRDRVMRWSGAAWVYVVPQGVPTSSIRLVRRSSPPITAVPRGAILVVLRDEDVARLDALLRRPSGS